MSGMHWVKATTQEGGIALVNLAAVPSMARTEGKDAVTILFLGGVCTLPNGGMAYAQTRVKEAPEKLFALPVIPAAAIGSFGQVYKGVEDPLARLKKMAGRKPAAKKRGRSRKAA